MLTLVKSQDLDRELERFEFPEQFALGVSSSGYQSEGGYNGADELKNNWYFAERDGKVERTGPGARFVEKHVEDLDRAAWIGTNAFRLGVDWARLQPGVDPALTSPQPFSTEAAEFYANVIAAAQARGMAPAVTLYHWSHPLWLGRDLWLDWPRARELFGAYVEFAVTAINRRLVARGNPPIPYFITMNEPISYPMTAHGLGVFPIGETHGVAAGLRCYENEMMAHVLAYRAIHRIYRENGWPRPTVTVNTWCSAAYTFDKMTQDLLLARSNGVAQADVPRFLADQRARFVDRMGAVPYRNGPAGVKRLIDRGFDYVYWRRLKHAPMPALTELIYAGEEERPLDALGFDIYDPFWGNNIDFEFPRLVRARLKPYEWGINPAALRAALECYSWTAGDLPIHLLENGLSYRAVGTRVWPHPDGLRRDEALQDMLFTCVQAIRDGLRLRSYFYWSLTDNYEWGSFEPRFGLFGVDYENNARRLPTDIMGNNAGGAYRLLAEAFRAKDKRALKEALTRRDYPRISS